ncbi:hypothetical protein F4604DRAFT_995177 [Suillus subluteus]|nr:hypothetical protein F4604DRAFT_995177 [Suillus subluteus]
MTRLSYPSQPAVTLLPYPCVYRSYFYHSSRMPWGIPPSSLHRRRLSDISRRLSWKAGIRRVPVIWRLINGRLSAVFILVCGTILVLASSVNLILVSCRHPSSSPSGRIRIRRARPLLGVGRSELEPEPGVISSFIATFTSTLTTSCQLMFRRHHHYLHQVEIFYRISISIFVLDSNWGKGSALCFEPGLAMIPSAMAFVSSPSIAKSPAPSPYLCYMPRSTSTSQSPLIHHVSLYISSLYPTTIALPA